MKVVFVLVGGGLGATTRYGITQLAGRICGTLFPWGTLAVNLLGCFLIGALFELADYGEVMSPSMRLFAMTGFLGGLTTFSTYGLESMNFARTGMPWSSIMNLIANNVGGLGLVLFGIWLTRALIAAR